MSENKISKLSEILYGCLTQHNEYIKFSRLLAFYLNSPEGIELQCYHKYNIGEVYKALDLLVDNKLVITKTDKGGDLWYQCLDPRNLVKIRNESRRLGR